MTRAAGIGVGTVYGVRQLVTQGRGDRVVLAGAGEDDRAHAVGGFGPQGRHGGRLARPGGGRSTVPISGTVPSTRSCVRSPAPSGSDPALLAPRSPRRDGPPTRRRRVAGRRDDHGRTRRAAAGQGVARPRGREARQPPARRPRAARRRRAASRTARASRRGSAATASACIVRLDALDDAARAAPCAPPASAIERESARRGLVEGWTPAGGAAGARGARRRPLRASGRSRADARRTLHAGGDVASRANLARAPSASTGAACASASSRTGSTARRPRARRGDLPAGQPVVPPGCSAGQRLRGHGDARDRARPGAGRRRCCSRAASTARWPSCEAVECLTAAGANVIVDDLGFFGEPYFEDGDLAQAVRAAVQAGCPYHTAAGNAALVHYEAPFRASPAVEVPRLQRRRRRRQHQRRVDPAGRLAALRAAVGRPVRRRRRRLRPAPGRSEPRRHRGQRQRPERATAIRSRSWWRSNDCGATEVDGLVIERARGAARDARAVLRARRRRRWST